MVCGVVAAKSLNGNEGGFNVDSTMIRVAFGVLAVVVLGIIIMRRRSKAS